MPGHADDSRSGRPDTVLLLYELSGLLPKSFDWGYTVALRKLRYYSQTTIHIGQNWYGLRAGWYLCRTKVCNSPATHVPDKDFINEFGYMLDCGHTTEGESFYPLGINVNMMPQPTLTTRLTANVGVLAPLKVKGKQTYRGQLRQNRTRDLSLTMQLPGSVPWIDTVVSAATGVVKIIKVAVDVASVLAEATLKGGRL